MDGAMDQLDAALADYHRAEGMADAQEAAAERLAEAAEAVLSGWDFDRGIPRGIPTVTEGDTVSWPIGSGLPHRVGIVERCGDYAAWVTWRNSMGECSAWVMIEKLTRHNV